MSQPAEPARFTVDETQKCIVRRGTRQPLKGSYDTGHSWECGKVLNQLGRTGRVQGRRQYYKKCILNFLLSHKYSMDYQKHYNLLIERAKTRSTDFYTETHHIIPRCMGGSNSKDNLVELTPEEHYLAHQLLVKLHSEIPGLLYAALYMSTAQGTRKNNKVYGWLRRRAAVVASSRKHSDQTKRKLAKLASGRILSAETKLKMSLAKKGKRSPLAANQKRHKRLVINGIEYNSRADAIRQLNVNPSTIYKWLRNGKAVSL